METFVDLLVSHYAIGPASSTDLSDVQIQNSLPNNDKSSQYLLAKISKLSKQEKLSLAGKVNLAGFKKYTCQTCHKSFVQRKRDGRLRLIRHLQKSHNVKSDIRSPQMPTAVKNETNPLNTEEARLQIAGDFRKDLVSFEDQLMLPFTPSSLRPLDQLFEGHEVSLNMANMAEKTSTQELVDKTCRLVAQSNVAALFFSNVMFKELAPFNSGVHIDLPHLPTVLLEKRLAATERILALFSRSESVALTVDYFDYGKLPVQTVMAYTMDDTLKITKLLISFKAVHDKESKIEVLRKAVAHWKIEAKVLCVTSYTADHIDWDFATCKANLAQSSHPKLDELIPLRIPSFGKLAEKVIEILFQEELCTGEIIPIGNADGNSNALRRLVVKLKQGILFIKADVDRERAWRKSLQEKYGWLATDTDILLWNGAVWTEFCDFLVRASNFVEPMNAFLASEKNPELMLTGDEKEGLGLVLNLTLPLCTWVNEFSTDTIQMHSYLIHLKKIRLLLAYMCMCDLFDAQVPEASKYFEDFVAHVESDKQLFKFLLLAYLLSGGCSLYDDKIFEELKQDLVEILTSDEVYRAPHPAREVDAFFAYISSPRRVEPLPEEFWRVHQEKYPHLFKVAMRVLTVRPTTLSLTTKCGKYVLNHLRTPRHVTRSESLLTLAVEDECNT